VKKRIGEAKGRFTGSIGDHLPFDKIQRSTIWGGKLKRGCQDLNVTEEKESKTAIERKKNQGKGGYVV